MLRVAHGRPLRRARGRSRAADPSRRCSTESCSQPRLDRRYSRPYRAAEKSLIIAPRADARPREETTCEPAVHACRPRRRDKRSKGTGVHPTGRVHANLTAPALVAHALRRDEGTLSEDGALMVRTGVHTGRSAQDKFIVDEPAITDDVWWRMGQPEAGAGELRRAARPGAGLSAGPASCSRRTSTPAPTRRTASASAWSAPRRGTRCSPATCSSARPRRSWRASQPGLGHPARARISRPTRPSTASAPTTAIALSLRRSS